MRRTLTMLVLAGGVLSAAHTAVAQTPGPYRFVAAANVGVQTQTIVQANTATFDLWEETGSIDTTQPLAGSSFDGGAAMRLWRHTAIGLTVSHTGGRTDGAIDALVPHPFFFDFHRQADTTAPDLQHRELGVHVQAQYWLPLGDSLQVTVSAGPTFFDVVSEVVTGITTSEVGYPLDQIDIVSHQTQQVVERDLGYNVGVDVAYFFLDRYGFGLTARYSQGTSSYSVQGEQQPELELGGLHVSGGVRVGF